MKLVGLPFAMGLLAYSGGPLRVQTRGSAIIRLVLAIFRVKLTIHHLEVESMSLYISVFDSALLLGVEFHFERHGHLMRLNCTL